MIDSRNKNALVWVGLVVFSNFCSEVPFFHYPSQLVCLNKIVKELSDYLKYVQVYDLAHNSHLKYEERASLRVY